MWRRLGARRTGGGLENPQDQRGESLKDACPAATAIDLQISRRRLISGKLMKPTFEHSCRRKKGHGEESAIPFSAISLAPFEVDFRAHQYVNKVEESERERERYSMKLAFI